MKVLWFTNSPCGSIRRFSKSVKAGGWMISLEDEIKNNADIELSVAYISSKYENTFKYDNVTYYPLWRNEPQNRVKRILYRFISNRKLDAIILPELLNIVNVVRPDLIHIHGTEEFFGLIQDKIKNIPIVFSIQGLIAPYKEKYFTGISLEDAMRNESVFDKLRKVSIIDDYKSFCYRAKREDHYLSNAQYILGRTFWDMSCSYALNPKRIYFVVNEILRDEFYHARWQKKSYGGTIKLVSTLSYGIYKGYEVILKTADLLSKYSGLKFEWHVIGYSESTKWKKIAEKSVGLITDNYPIILRGRLDAQNMVDEMLACDMYIHVSHIENSPNSVCEAMLLGMPIIASFAGGTASLFENVNEGILYQDGDPYVLAGCILQLSNNFHLAKRMGDAAFKHAVIRHNKSRVVNELIDSYRQILDDFHK